MGLFGDNFHCRRPALQGGGHLKTLDIIIVNWNSGCQLRQCLGSISSTGGKGLILERVLVVDNASRDGSADGLEDLGLPLLVKKNQENRGFAAGCNQGAKGSKADFLLFLNPDTILFQDSLNKPIAFLEGPLNSSVGIVGIQLLDENSKINKTCARFPSAGMFIAKALGLDRLLPSIFTGYYMQQWDHRSNRLVDQVMGAFFLVRRCLFEALGGFDQRFFIYFEEVDFSLRARQGGWHSYYLAEAQVYHKGGGTTEQVKGLRLFYSLRSRILYGYKHFTWPSAAILMGWSIFVEPLAHLTRALCRGSIVETREVLKGTAKLWWAIPRFLKVSVKSLLGRR